MRTEESVGGAEGGEQRSAMLFSDSRLYSHTEVDRIMPHVPSFPSSDRDEEDERSETGRRGIIDRIIGGGVPSGG
ncbi:uncharacterized protein Nmag_0913 [Natrialba magadii ATCC 43099]|uniref:Uncharacterized protein n=2 Tax=Natrialba magadii (strain ATCC 43099 / DSM 3394 / CCM 3739 / CIP 104546 / IAM 13178 / JCM 8861 / NBRC 102185 / NCIMB 2190 / MS3) TaxID=547559 RepID=D3SQK9_NATMM|nr:uncharacterized protein Nmag_0913 [Natrialba magadii ATCC 43099]